MNLREFILHVGGNAVVAPDKYLRAGHNGPYHDPETSVRNFGHWLVTFAKCHEWTGEKRFKDRVADLSEYLSSKEARPYGFTFHHRNKPDKDRCNGLIGQAWTFEALAEASALLKDERYGQLAEEVFFQHPFDQTLGLWKRLEIDGQILSFDATFNHQLWFAACSSLIRSKRRGELSDMITRFLNCLKDNLTVLNGGLAYHPIEHLFDTHFESKDGRSARMKKKFASVLRFIREGRRPARAKSYGQVKAEMREKLISKSVGYHCFNMYAFALLQQSFPKHSYWATNSFASMVDYLLTEGYNEGLEDNRYGYPYNPPGFEVPYALSILKAMPKKRIMKTCNWWVNKQLKRCYNAQTQMMDRNTEDPLTHTARIYELVRLDDALLSSIEITQLHPCE